MPRALAVLSPAGRAAACCPPTGKPRARELTAYAALFKALGDETRLRILGYLLAKGDSLCACHIEDRIKELSQPTISHHLRLLREAGLVTAERRGTWIYYAVDPTVRARLAEFVALLGA
jgi:ArsR family transcriptional regulator